MPSHRAHVIVQLLEQYNDLADPMLNGNGSGATGVMLMPTTYSGCDSVRELERLLRVMRDDRHSPLLRTAAGDKVSVRACWWNVSRRYLECTMVMRTLTWRRGKWVGLGTHAAVVSAASGWEVELAKERAKRRHAGMEVRVKLATWDPGVRADRVACGVGWICDHWALGHEPMLPVMKSDRKVA